MIKLIFIRTVYNVINDLFTTHLIISGVAVFDSDLQSVFLHVVGVFYRFQKKFAKSQNVDNNTFLLMTKMILGSPPDLWGLGDLKTAPRDQPQTKN